MPNAPPPLRKRPTPKAWASSSTKSRQERGYGREHDLMREQVLREEPLCQLCLAMDPPRYTRSGVADHKVPKAEGGTDDRGNYQALGYPRSRHPDGCDCHEIKTAAERKRANARKRTW